VLSFVPREDPWIGTRTDSTKPADMPTAVFRAVSDTFMDMIDVALKYAAMGLPVFPLYGISAGRCACSKECPSPGKHPKTGKGFKDASTDQSVVKRLFAKLNCESTNIGIRTGREANLVVVDVDVAKGAVLEDLFAIVGKEVLETTWCVQTGGGFHYLFTYPQTGLIKNSASKILQNVDVRGEGGYIVAPPSMHVTGKQYKTIKDCARQPFPSALTELLNPSNSSQPNDGAGKIVNNRNCSLTSLAGTMRRRGMSNEAILTALRVENRERCVEPLPDVELIKIAKSMQNYPPGDSSAARPVRPLLDVRSGNEWIADARQTPTPSSICDGLVLEGQCCILFGETGSNKSCLAVQIGESAARGQAIPGLTMSADSQRVLYLDFELSAKQFQHRYSDEFNNNYQFSDNFLRAAITRDLELPDGVQFEAHLFKSIENLIDDKGIKLLIVDNITYLGVQTETAKDALPLMKALLSIKHNHAVTLLIIAHTPKIEEGIPITINHLQGSKMLSNFADSVFALGKSSQDHSVRYIKQIKQRDAELRFHDQHVAVFDVQKKHNFLGLRFKECEPEAEHLRSVSKPVTAKQIATDFLKGELRPGPKSSEEIKKKAFGLGIHDRTLLRAKKDLQIVANKDGFFEGWSWVMPGTPPEGSLRPGQRDKPSDGND
jgi:hypothetical protein